MSQQPTSSGGAAMSPGRVKVRLVFAALAVAGMAAVVGVAPTGDPDVWWHLKTGEQALAQGSTLPEDPFSYSFAGKPWLYKDLIADALLYLAFAALGFFGFLMLKVVVAGAMAAAVWQMPRPKERSMAVWLASTALLLGLVGLNERPYLFSWAFFPILLALAERARARCDERRPWRLVAAFLPLVAAAWAWAWLHRAAVIGPALITCLALALTVESALARWLAPSGPRPSGRALLAGWIAAALAWALGCLNPSGVELYRTTLSLMGSELFRERISNWTRLSPGELLATFPLTCGLGLAVITGTVLRLVLALRRGAAAPVGLWHAGVVVGAAVVTLDSVRWAPYLAMTAALVGARLCGEAVAWLGRRLGEQTVPRGVTALVFVASLALLWTARVDPFRLGEAEHAWPTGAIAFARDQGLSGKVANAFALGGYLIWKMWPDARVLVDGRNDIVYPQPFVARAIGAERSPELFAAMRREDGATWVMANNNPSRASHLFLARDPRWALVYWSEAATVYVERERHPQLAPLTFRFVHPTSVDSSVYHAVSRYRRDPAALQMIGAEVQRLIDASPRGVRAHAARVVYFHALGPGWVRQRDEAMRRLEQIDGDHHAVAQLRDRLAGAAARGDQRPTPN